MFKRLLRLGPKPGTVWEGPAAFCHDYAAVPRPGYYALEADGKQFAKPLVRLVCVDDAPGDPEDGACHYEVAAKHDPVAKQGNIVHVESHTHGSGSVSG